MHINYKWKYLGIIILLIAGYFFLFYFSVGTNKHTLCLFKNITNIPCPACGSGRATILLFHGEIWKSLMLNPLAIVTNILILGSIIWMILDIFKGKERFFPFLKKDVNWKWKVLLVVIIFSNWIWNIVKGL